MFADPEKKISFQMSLALSCNADWVHCPDYLELMNLGRMISVKIDPTSLSAGVHNTWLVSFIYCCFYYNRKTLCTCGVCVVYDHTV